MDKNPDTVSGQGDKPAPASGKAWRIIPATAEHLPGMAVCHMACFPDVFASRMGLAFVQEFYKGFLKDTDGFLLVAQEAQSNRVLGVVIGGRPGMWRQFTKVAIRRYAGRIAYKFLVDGVVRRAICREVLRRLGLRRSRRQGQPDDQPMWPAGRPFAVLRVLGVLPCARGSGLAGELTAAFGAVCRSAGYEGMCLEARPENKRGIAFYRKDGWEMISESKAAVFMIRHLHTQANK